MQPRHHSPDRGAHDLGDLLVGETLNVGQVDRQAEVFRESLQRRLDVRVRQALQRLGLGRLEAA
jgi:hypothetical protein